MAFRGGSQTKEDTKQLFKWIFENYEKQGFELWAIIHKVDKKLIGNCGLISQEINGQRETEMGYILAKEYWRRGLATDAACATRDYGFEQLGCKRIIALIDPNNIASQKVAMKVGLTYEKDIIQFKKTVGVYAIHKS